MGSGGVLFVALELSRASWLAAIQAPGGEKASRHKLAAGASAEAAVSRYERVIGDALRSRTDRRRATEAAIGVHVLNRMPEPGRLESVRIA